MAQNELIEQILKLPVADREDIVDAVLASLDDEPPDPLTGDEQKEILQRVERFHKNPETFLTWEQVKAQLAKQRAERSA